MNSFRPASTPTIRGARIALLRALTPEERKTYRRWAWTVLTGYCFIFVWSIVAIRAGATHDMASADDPVTRVSSQSAAR